MGRNNGVTRESALKGWATRRKKYGKVGCSNPEARIAQIKIMTQKRSERVQQCRLSGLAKIKAIKLTPAEMSALHIGHLKKFLYKEDSYKKIA